MRQGITQPDVTIDEEGHSSLYLFHLETDRAREWVEENVAEQPTNLKGALVIGHVVARALAVDMLEDGLELE